MYGQVLESVFFMVIQHQRVLGWIEVSANNVLKFFNTICIVGKFDRLEHPPLDFLSIFVDFYVHLIPFLIQ